MKRALGLIMTALLLASLLAASPVGPVLTRQAPVRFAAYDLVIDAGASPLAAYEVEITTGEGAAVALAGVEGGADPAFERPPHYDPAALHAAGLERIVLAAYTLADPLPVGAVRVARLHLRVEGEGEPAFNTRLIAAGADERTPIDARVRLIPADAPQQGDR